MLRLGQDVRFWVLFLGFLCSAGSGLVVINNIASLAQSLDMASSDLLVRCASSTHGPTVLGCKISASSWFGDEKAA